MQRLLSSMLLIFAATLLNAEVLLVEVRADVRADVQPRVADLAWMTGNWVGPIGDQTLEENWVLPSNGTIACFVRFVNGGKTNMYELIVIEEEAESLVFRVRQWQPGFTPIEASGQKMILAEIGERRVSFEAVGVGNFQTLSYSRDQDDRFNIAVETQDGGSFQIQLTSKP